MASPVTDENTAEHCDGLFLIGIAEVSGVRNSESLAKEDVG